MSSEASFSSASPKKDLYKEQPLKSKKSVKAKKNQDPKQSDRHPILSVMI
jgi:hypothetical protein